MKMSQTRTTAMHRVLGGQLNDHGTLYGGQILYWLDEAASVSAHRFAQRELATGAVDQMNFLAPARVGDAVEFESVVTGAGHRSLEVFTRMMVEDLTTGARILAGTALITFVAASDEPLPSLEVDSAAERTLAAGYLVRKAANDDRRQALREAMGE